MIALKWCLLSIFNIVLLRSIVGMCLCVRDYIIDAVNHLILSLLTTQAKLQLAPFAINSRNYDVIILIKINVKTLLRKCTC